MGTTKIILKQDIPQLGEEGDIKIVKRGFARNFLFPKNIAVEFNKQNKNILETQKAQIEKKKLLKKENSLKLKEALEKEKITLTIPAGEKGRLYGTVTSSLIHEELLKLNYSIDKREIELKEHIKFGGNYKYRIHLYQDVYANLELVVIADQEKHEEQAKGSKKKRNASKEQDAEIQAEETPVEESADTVLEESSEEASTTESEN